MGANHIEAALCRMFRHSLSANHRSCPMDAAAGDDSWPEEWGGPEPLHQVFLQEDKHGLGSAPAASVCVGICKANWLSVCACICVIAVG